MFPEVAESAGMGEVESSSYIYEEPQKTYAVGNPTKPLVCHASKEKMKERGTGRATSQEQKRAIEALPSPPLTTIEPGTLPRDLLSLRPTLLVDSGDKVQHLCYRGPPRT